MSNSLRVPLLLAGALLCGPVHGSGPGACADEGTASGPTATLRVDNDVFGGQDQGYSSGIQLRLASSDLGGRDVSRETDAPDDALPDSEPCVWPLTSWLGRHLEPLKPQRSTRQNLTLSVSHAIFTPVDRRRTDLIRNDRPYAAALLLGLGYNARTQTRLRATLVEVGIVGPSARGRRAQNEIHKITRDKPFLGWDNQLGDEGLFRVLQERVRRHVPSAAGDRPGYGRWDAITHWGASLGNLLTQANLGGELRWGRNLPEDFGSTPTRPAGEVPARRRGAGGRPASGPSAHGFASVDMRWVLHDFSLDGNTFKDSHRVDRQPGVAEFGYGLVLTWGGWKIVLARLHRSLEFKGQKELPVYGSVSVSWTPGNGAAGGPR